MGNGDGTLYVATQGFQTLHLTWPSQPLGQVGQWCRPYSHLSNWKGRRLTGLFQVAQLVRGRARVRTKALWLSVQGSFNTMNSESQIKPCGSVSYKALSIVIHLFTTGPWVGGGGVSRLKGWPYSIRDSWIRDEKPCTLVPALSLPCLERT